MSTQNVYAENEVLELNSVKKAKLDELANNEIETQVKEGKLSQMTNLVGLIGNFTPKEPLTLHNTHVWAGDFIMDPPTTINRTVTPGKFLQTIPIDGGCKGAVVYAGYNQQNQECGWLLAWLKAGGSLRKVYAHCGPIIAFDNIDWDDIESKLDASGDSIYVICKATGTEISAIIAFMGGQNITSAIFY